jgi:hypothetical protein
MRIGNKREARDMSVRAKSFCFGLCALLLALCVSAQAQQRNHSQSFSGGAPVES